MDKKVTIDQSNLQFEDIKKTKEKFEVLNKNISLSKKIFNAF